MKRALITGGAGFIGSHLSERLLGEGLAVVGVDNLITGSESNIRGIDSANYEFIKMDVSQGLDGVDGQFDYVLHFASPASPPDYLRHPVETLLAGSAATHAALEVAKANGAVFMLASTSEVYGDPDQHPQTESYHGNVNPIGPRSCYDEAKRYAEAATMAYKRAHGVDTRIIRIFNTYGPRMRRDDGRAVSNFINQALDGKDITVYGDGSQTRSFCYVSDLVDGITRLLFSSEPGPVNIGNPDEIRIVDLARTIIGYTGSSSKVAFKPLPEDDPKMRKPDITLAKKALGWEPVFPLKDGLFKTIEYYRETSDSVR